MRVLKEPAARATVVFIVLAVATIVALWPRNGAEQPVSAESSSSAAPTATLPPVDDGELAALRTDAALRPCPNGTGPAAAGSALAGVSVPCMATGAPIDLGAVTAGKPLVINMWAVWCLPCRKELPLFDALSQRAGDRLNVVAVHAREGGDNELFVLKFLEEVGVHVPAVTDPKGAVAKALRAPRIFPSTILVRADGTVAEVLPQIFRSEAELDDAVRAHLGVDVSAP